MIETAEAQEIGEEAWRSDRGSLRIRRPRPEVLIFVEEGHLESGFAPLIRKASNDALRVGKPIYMFVDAYNLSGYAPEVRKVSTNWLSVNRQSVAVQHMLVRSKLTKMGLSVASLTLGGLIQGHASRASFRQALDSTMRELSGEEVRVFR